MPTTLITLPCTARQLENALHAVCDHGKPISSSFITYAWFVWQKGYKGDTILKWFN